MGKNELIQSVLPPEMVLNKKVFRYGNALHLFLEVP